MGPRGEHASAGRMIPSNIEISSKKALRSLSSTKTKHRRTSPTFSKSILSKHVNVGKMGSPDLHASSLTEATAMLAAEDSFQTFVDEYAECDIPDDGVSSLGDPSIFALGDRDFRAIGLHRPTRQRGSILSRDKILGLADRGTPSASRNNRQGRPRNRARSFDDTDVEGKLDVSRHSAGRYSMDDALDIERRLELGCVKVENIKTGLRPKKSAQTSTKVSEGQSIGRPKRSKSADRTLQINDHANHNSRRRSSSQIRAARSRSLGRPASFVQRNSEKHANLSDKSLWSGHIPRSFRKKLPEASDGIFEGDINVRAMPCRADTSSRSFPPTDVAASGPNTATSDLLEVQRQLAEEKERNAKLTNAFKETRHVAEKAIHEVRKLQEINLELQARLEEKTGQNGSSDDGNNNGSITHAMAIRLHKKIAALEAENQRLRSNCNS